MKRIIALLAALLALAVPMLAAAVPGAPAIPVISVIPAISPSGGGMVGTVLSIPTYAGATYQWLRGGSPISGATSNSYTTVSADGGTTVAVAVTVAGVTVTSSSYSTNGVLFSNALSGLTTNGAAMTTGAGTVPDTSHFTIFAEFRLNAGNSAVSTTSTSLFTDFVSSEQNIGDGTESLPGIVPFILDNAAGNYGTWRFNIGDSTAATGGSAHNCLMNGYFSRGIEDSAWHWFLATGNLTASGTTKDIALYIDGSVVGQTCNYSTGGTMVAAISARGFAIRDFLANSLTTGAGRIEFGDVFADYATDAICMDNSTPIVRNGTSYACTTQDTVPTALLAKFWSSGPVDLGSTGSNPFGRQPEIFLGHGAGPSTWQTNLGSVNNLTTTGPLYNAAYAPNTTPTAHRVFTRWSTSAYGTPAVDTTEAMNTGGNAIVAGDLLLAGIVGTDTSGSTAHGLASACPSGFALTQAVAGTGNTVTSMMVCAKIATGSEGPTITSGSFVAFARGVRWFLMDMGNVTGVRTSSAATVNDTGPGATTLAAPTLTGTSGDELLTLVGSWNGTQTGGGSPTPYAKVTPGAGDVVLSSDLVSTYPQITVAQELLSTSGTTSVRTFTETNRSGGAAPDDWGAAISIDIQPN